jgi:hypothetical protein
VIDVLYKGTLEAILRIGYKSGFRSDTPIGPIGGGISTNGSIFSLIQVKTKDGSTVEFEYQGIILSDSIGNEIEVYQKDNSERCSILDFDLNRTYE